MRNIFLALSLLSLLFLSCDLSKSKDKETPLARVNDAYLMVEDIDLSEFKGLTPKDSLLQVQTKLRNWATQQLLIDGATLNLEEQQQQDFEALVEQYRTDLYTSAYLEALVKRNLDTSITDTELSMVYNKNKELFVLKESLIKLRYINIESNISNIKEIKQRFKRYNTEDQAILDTMKLIGQLKNEIVNDAIKNKKFEIYE